MTALFDHRDVGTPEGVWQASRLQRCRPLDPPGKTDRLLVVAAHPDDETLGAGGLLALAANEGAGIVVAIATDGERSHPSSPTHSPQQLTEIRRREMSAAVSAVAPNAELIAVGLPDGDLGSHIEELTARLEQLAEGCTHIVTPWADDGHPDHEACAVAGSRVAERHALSHWQYPIWAWHWGHPDSGDLPWDQTRILPLSRRAADLKAAGLMAYESQHSALSTAPGDEAVLNPSTLSYFSRSYETFVVTAAPASSASYFESLYLERGDPWSLEGRFYEQRKRSIVMASLPRRRFKRVFEPGCSIGLLTAELANRCDRVIAWDLSEEAVSLARERLSATNAADVEVGVGRVPGDWPSGQFDLVVLSEIAYYFADLSRLKSRLVDSLADDGVLVACHWRHRATDHPHDAETVHRKLGEGLQQIASHVEEDFLLDVWDKHGRSVARAEGIA